MYEDNQQTGITDIPYVDVPPMGVGESVNAVSGNIGGVKVSLGQTEAGGGSNAIGQVSQKGNEYFYVGNAENAIALLGQIKQKTGVSEYGIWIGTTGQYLKYTVADGLVIYGGGIQAGNIHIPDKNTTADSLHVDSTGNLWIGCTETAFIANHKNAKAYILKNGDLFAGNAEISGTLKTTVFQKDVVSAIGGQLIVSNSDVLDVDMTALDASTLTIKGTTTLDLNSILLIKDGVDEEWMRVTNVGSAPTYTVTRDLAGAYASNNNPVWKKGGAVVVMGISNGTTTYSGGWLRLIGGGVNSPHYSVFSRTGVAYNAYSEACRLGNLNGVGGKVADCYGLFLGNYTKGKYIMYDDVSEEFIVSGNLKPLLYVRFGEAVDANRAVRMGGGGDTKFYLASGTSSYTAITFVGFTIQSYASGDWGFIQYSGLIPLDYHINAGLPYYLKDGTPFFWKSGATAGSVNVYGGSLEYAEVFTLGADAKLDNICISGTKVGAGCNLVIDLYNTSGGVPTTLKFSGVYTAYSTGGTITVADSYAPYPLVAGTTYAIVIKGLGGDAGNYHTLDYQTVGAGTGGYCTKSGGVWTATTTRDLKISILENKGLVDGTPGSYTLKAGICVDSNHGLLISSF